MKISIASLAIGLASLAGIALIAGLFVGAPDAARASSRAAAMAEVDDDAFPPTLKETGYFRSVANHELKKGFAPFDVNASYWSDDAEKIRAVYLPEGVSVKFEAEKPWFFPVGTVFIKTFQLTADGETRRIETRVIRRAKFGWLFSTYTWNDEQTGAVLEMDGPRFPVTAGHTSQAWGVPHQLDCLECHNDAAGRVLGFSLAQLNKFEKTPKGRVNQLHRLEKVGILKGVPEKLEGLAAFCSPYDKSADLDDRARTYLQVNCSMCHQPESPQTKQFNLPLDLRMERPIYETGLLEIDPENPTGRPLRPRSLRRTLFLNRVGSIGRFRMPPLGTLMIDEKGHAMLTKWFAGFLEN